MLRAARTAAGARRRDEAGDFVRAALPRRVEQVAGKLAPKHGVRGAAQAAVAGGDELLLAFAHKAEGDFRVGQRRMGDSVGDKVAFADVLFQKLHAGGGVVEQIADRDGRTAPARARLQPLRHAARDAVAQREFIGVALGQQFDARHAGDGGQRLAAEAQRVDVGQVFGGRDLAGGMADEGVFDGVRFDAGAVVGDLQLLDAAAADRERDLRRPGVDGVFEQFFRHRGRPLDNFARGDELGGVLV